MKSAWTSAFALLFVMTAVGAAQTTGPTGPAPGGPAVAKAPARTGAKGEGEITEAELRQKLVGRPLYLRGLWLDETLHFNMYGDLASQSPKGSFTLCGVMIDHVRMTKKSVELEGVRFGVHFEGEAPWEEQATSFDRIQITPKKKHQVIVIDRQLVVIPKRKKGGKKDQDQGAAAGAENASADAGGSGDGSPNAGQTAVADAELANPQATGNAGKTPEPTTTSPAESAEHLRAAINRIFAPDLDEKMVAQMPDYWQFFYQAQRSRKLLVPTDQSLAHPGPGVDGPRLLKNVVPASNDFAQKGEVAGVASYKVILDPQGKILAVAVYRPIGFGLDENAVAAIQKSTFAPAVKDGKAVPSVIDVAVNFRIYSKRTAATAPESADADTPANTSPVTGKPSMPGPYTSRAAAQGQPEAQAHQ
jgi:hypothetical protein